MPHATKNYTTAFPNKLKSYDIRKFPFNSILARSASRRKKIAKHPTPYLDILRHHHAYQQTT
jgi:hypothetical protein